MTSVRQAIDRHLKFRYVSSSTNRILLSLNDDAYRGLDERVFDRLSVSLPPWGDPIIQGLQEFFHDQANSTRSE